MLRLVTAWATRLPQAPPVAPQQRPDAAAVRTTIERVFTDPELARGLRPQSELRTFRSLLDWLGQQWLELTRYLEQLRLASPFTFWMVNLVLVVTLALLVWHIVYTMRRVFRAPAPDRPGSGAGGNAPETRLRDSATLRAEARRLAAALEFRDAARHLLLALLALLEERRIVHVARGWTNREILGRVATRCGDSDDLRTFGRTLEQTSYGRAELGTSGFAHLDTMFDGLRDHLHERSGGRADARGGGQR